MDGLEPEKAKKSGGDFVCPICESRFTRKEGVNYHFPSCVEKYGNPEGKRWNEHPSCSGKDEANKAPASKKRRVEIVTSSSSVRPQPQALPRPTIVPTGTSKLREAAKEAAKKEEEAKTERERRKRIDAMVEESEGVAWNIAKAEKAIQEEEKRREEEGIGLNMCVHGPPHQAANQTIRRRRVTTGPDP